MHLLDGFAQQASTVSFALSLFSSCPITHVESERVQAVHHGHLNDENNNNNYNSIESTITDEKRTKQKKKHTQKQKHNRKNRNEALENDAPRLCKLRCM